MTSKHFFTLLGLLAVLSCGQKSNSSADDSGEAAKEQLQTERVGYSHDADKKEVTISVDYPTGNDGTSKAIAEYVSETLGGSYDGDLADGQALADYYGEELLADLNRQHQEDISDGVKDEDIEGYYHKVAIHKIYETDRLVTLAVTKEIYLNGAHGTEYTYGQTFRKDDGRRFDAGMMRDLYSEEMCQLRKEGLRQYFLDTGIQDSINTDEQLKEFILTEDDVNFLPMPQQPPFVTDDGIVFIYQPYEISFYAAGAPQFTLSLKKMRPFLKQTARQMLGL